MIIFSKNILIILFKIKLIYKNIKYKVRNQDIKIEFSKRITNWKSLERKKKWVVFIDCYKKV